MRRHLSAAGLGAIAAALAGSAAAQGFWNVEFLGEFRRGTRDVYAAVWGYTAPDGTELAILGNVDGTSFVDVTNPRAPVEVAFVRGPSSTWREMQTHAHYAYIVTEGGGGMQIVDLAEPLAPRLVAAFDSTFTTAHTLHIRDGYAYVNGTNNGLRILDLAAPERPRDVGSYQARYVHDSFVRGTLAYLANINAGGFTILDVSDRSAPREVSFTQYLGAATHNMGTTKDGLYLLTTDENAGGHLRIWNVSDVRAPFQVADWSAHEQASIHNVVVRGDSAYLAYYTEGLQVLDISRPEQPLFVGFYDTMPGVAGGFRGNWGVYPFARHGAIYLSDMESGLVVVRMAPGGQPVLDFRLSPPSSHIALPGQQQILFFFDLFNGASGARTFDLTVTNDAGWTVDVQPVITLARSATEPIPVTVHVPAGIGQPTRVDLELCARSRATGHSSCARTRLAVPVALQDFTAVFAGGGVDLRWRLAVPAGETGWIVVQRAAAGGAFEERARLALDAGGWRDAVVEPGLVYAYRLVVDAGGDVRILGETTVVAAAPERSHLVGAWPNPFPARTHLGFVLARPGDARLRVHDARGRLLREVLAPGLRPGPHALVWDGADAAGHSLPAGVYFYEVHSGGWGARGRVTRLR